MANTNLIQGDNSEAFGQNLLRIRLKDDAGLLNNHSISKCEIKFSGCMSKTIENPQFPLIINLTSEESYKLSVGNNKVAFAVWDEEGRKLTAEGTQIVVLGAKRV